MKAQLPRFHQLETTIHHDNRDSYYKAYGTSDEHNLMKRIIRAKPFDGAILDRNNDHSDQYTINASEVII